MFLNPAPPFFSAVISRIRTPSSTIRALAVFSALCCFTSTLNASPWISAGDARARHHLNVLTQSNVLHLSTTSWPVAWVDVKDALENIENTAALTEQQLWSIDYLEHALVTASRRANVRAKSTLAAERTLADGFSAQSREKRSIQLSVASTTEIFASNIAVSYVDDPLDDKDWRLDDSYLAAALGNWALGIGAIDRWWGPGWQNSLALSHAARPAPGLFINRLQSTPSSLPVLEHLGAWHFSAFFNELQDGPKTIDDARMAGWRATAAPIAELELGVSATMIWSRWHSPTLSSEPSAAQEAPLEPSLKKASHLRSADIRFGKPLGETVTLAAYGQYAWDTDRAEGELRHQLAGFEISFMAVGSQHRLALEANQLDSDDANGRAPYTYAAHEGGYSHYGYSLGPASMGDSKTLMGMHYFSNGHNLKWTLSEWKLGEGALTRPVTTEPASAQTLLASQNQKSDITTASISYQLPISEKTLLELGANYYSETLALSPLTTPHTIDLNTENAQIGSGAFLTVHHHW